MDVLANNPVYAFADFRLDPTRRLLLHHGETIALHPKAFDLLLALVENRDCVLSKNELLDTVWKGQFVEENNLAVQISTLRKIFGEKKDEHRFIVTVPGKGYRFVADVREAGGETEEFVLESETVSRFILEDEEPINENIAALPNRSKKFRWAIALPLLLLAILGIGGYTWRLSQQAKISLSALPFQAVSIKRLTSKGNVQLAALSPDGKIFAFTTADFQQQSLWLGYVEGGDFIQLRPSSEVSYHWLAFAPDGSSLFYTLSDAATPTTLYKSPVFGGVQEKIKDGVAESLSISPDGGRIAFVKSKPESKRTSALMVSNTDGSKTQELVSLSGTRRFISESLSWSPDGLRIAYSALAEEGNLQTNLFAVRVADGQVEQITKNGWSSIGQTVWLNDGSGLIMLAAPWGFFDSVMYEQIWSVSYPGGEAYRVTADLSNYNTALSLSNNLSSLLSIEYRQTMNIWTAPANDLTQAKQITFGSFGKNDGFTGLAWLFDGKILFTSTTFGNQVISVMHADGGDVKQLTSPGYVDAGPTISDDGRYIFFHSHRSGLFEIWRMDVDGKNMVQLTKGGDNYQPYASPDGKWVYYKGWQDGIGTLWRIPATGGEPQQMTDKECSWNCVSPDGKYFACDYLTNKRRLAIFPIDGGQPIKQFEFPASSLRWFAMQWTPDSQSVAYRDKYYGIWKQPIEGDDPPQRIEGLPEEKIYRFAWSRDGKQFAFVRGTEIRDVVLISDVK